MAQSCSIPEFVLARHEPTDPAACRRAGERGAERCVHSVFPVPSSPQPRRLAHRPVCRHRRRERFRPPTQAIPPSSNCSRPGLLFLPASQRQCEYVGPAPRHSRPHLRRDLLGSARLEGHVQPSLSSPSSEWQYARAMHGWDVYAPQVVVNGWPGRGRRRESGRDRGLMSRADRGRRPAVAALRWVSRPRSARRALGARR